MKTFARRFVWADYVTGSARDPASSALFVVGLVDGEQVRPESGRSGASSFI